MYPIFRKCIATKFGLGTCFKSAIKQNPINHVAFNATDFSLVNTNKSKNPSMEGKTEKEEICRGRTRLDDDRLTDDQMHWTHIDHLTGNSDDGNARYCVSSKEGESSYSIYSSPEYCYDSDISQCQVNLKQELSYIRQIEYSSYGEELLKSDKIKSIENELLTIASYNVLAPSLLVKHSYLYRHHDKRCLPWTFRSTVFLEELEQLNADFLCFQEIDSVLVKSFYDKYLIDKGYCGIFKQRTRDKLDGCAIYFKRNKFHLIDSSEIELYTGSVKLLDRDNVGIVLKLSLKDKPNMELVVATTHLLYSPKREDIRLAQTQVMLAEIERVAYKGTDADGREQYLPIIFTGDFNCVPYSAVYQLLTTNSVTYEGKSRNFLTMYSDRNIIRKTLLPATLGITDTCQYASLLAVRKGANESGKELCFESGTLSHNLNLASVYSHLKNFYPEATTYQNKWITVDYIFYSKTDEKLNNQPGNRLNLVSKLQLPNSEEAETKLKNLPNLACASDHLPLMATFHWT